MNPTRAALVAMAKRAHESAPTALVKLLKTSDFAHGQWELFKEAGRFLSLAAAGGNSVRHCWDALSWRPPGGRGDGADCQTAFSNEQICQVSEQAIDTSLAASYKAYSLSLKRK